MRASFEAMVDDLYRRGYLDQAFPQGCVDDHNFVHVDPALVLEELLGKPDLWPLRKSRPEWDRDTFFDLVEVLHDLVARPRARWWHDWSSCGGTGPSSPASLRRCCTAGEPTACSSATASLFASRTRARTGDDSLFDPTMHERIS